MAHPRSNGAPNYLNGAGGNRVQRFAFDTTPETSADERSRSRGPGGYGGFGARGAEQVHAPSRIDRHHANRRSRGEDWSTSRSRSRPGVRYGTAGTQVEEILRYIEQQWSFMASDQCIPVKVALQLMDHSSLGLAEQQDQFEEAHRQLQNALKVVVNEHHQGFNSSIGTFHKIQTAIHASQHRVRLLRAGLLQAKGSLSTPRPELRAFANTSQSYDHMLQTISTIETLQLVPEKLEAQISEKRFLAAVATLQDALALVRRPEMEDIGALSELKVYLSNQEHSITDILIEELHSHLYLKSPYCDERWKANMHPSNISDVVLPEEQRAMHTFLQSYDGSTPMHEDPSRNPEAGTFYYIQLLVESLHKLARLDFAIDAIEQRLPVELFRVVERSHGEVEQRHPRSALHAYARSRRTALGMNMVEDGERKATLEDLLVTLYAKFEAIAEGHRVLHDVVAAIHRRESQSDSSGVNRSFRELWKLLQSEMRSLLHDHLSTDGNVAGQSRSASDPSGNIFKPQPRDRSRRLFKLADTDSKATEIATEREDLEFILKASVPGLVNTQQAQQAKQDRKTHTLSADRSAAGHKLLVEPSVFNMGVLLPPSLSFLHRLKDVVPPQSGVVPSALTAFLDDFLINVFHPQLEETLTELCSRAMNDIEAFQADNTATQKYSPRPLFRGTTRFFELIEAFCSMLDPLPHEQSFSQLIISQMRTYYDKCYQWSKSLLQRAMVDQSGGALKMRLAADLATTGEVNEAVIELMNVTPSTDRTKQSNGVEKTSDLLALAEKVSSLLVSLLKTRKLEEPDLINDGKAVAALCMLQVSVKWLAVRCQSLRYISPRAIDMSEAQNNRHHRSWTTNTDLSSAPPGPYLPLDAQTAAQFDAVLVSFTELSALVLRTLHIDLRLRLLQGIYTAMDTTYALGQPYNDPDAAILSLSNSLSSYDADVVTHLLSPQYVFLTTNLHVLVNDALCSFVSAIPAMDEYGIARMQLNVLVLQQALKNLQPTASLEKAARFYELGEHGPAEIVARGLEEGYRAADLKALLRLCWNAERDDGLGSLEEVVSKLG